MGSYKNLSLPNHPSVSISHLLPVLVPVCAFDKEKAVVGASLGTVKFREVPLTALVSTVTGCLQCLHTEEVTAVPNWQIVSMLFKRSSLTKYYFK